MMLQNDIREDNDNDGFIIPKIDVLGHRVAPLTSPTLAQKPKRYPKSKSTPWPDHKQQFHWKFVSYHEFLTSYWVHFPKHLTRDLGEE